MQISKISQQSNTLICQCCSDFWAFSCFPYSLRLYHAPVQQMAKPWATALKTQHRDLQPSPDICITSKGISNKNLGTNCLTLWKEALFSICSVEDEGKIVDSLIILENKLGYFNSDAFSVATLTRITSQGKTIRNKWYKMNKDRSRPHKR